MKKEQNPRYLQLYQKLREDIEAGIYPYGSKLPSKRFLADENGLSVITTEHAYSLLVEEGYIEARERSGYYVIFRNSDAFAALDDETGGQSNAASLHEAAAFSGLLEEAAPFPFSVLSKTMRKVISDYGEGILERSPNKGCEELRDAIRHYLAGSRRIFAGPEQIIIGAGSEYLYHLIVGLLGREKTFAIESPSYKRIEEVYQVSHVKYEMLPLAKDGIRSSALKASRADILHISPYRSFPSGVTASASKRHEYLRWASVPGRYIIEDDFESEFSVLRKPEETLFSQAENDNVIYMNTFSRSISPAFRTGYMVLPEHLLKDFDERLGFYTCTVPTYIQLVIAELIRDHDFERHINRVRRQKRKEEAAGR